MDMKNQPSSQLPGAVTFANDIGPTKGMRSLYNQQFNLQDMTQDIGMIQARIKTGFFNDMFMALSQNAIEPGSTKITAYQSAAIVNERLQVLGPVIESKLENLRTKLKRVYAIMERRGMIEPKPQGLKGIPLTVDFVSVLALAQKAASLGGVERLTAYIGNLAALYPEARDKLDAVASIELMNDLLGNPTRILNGPEKMAQLAQQRQQQQQQLQNMQMQQHVAQTASTAADAAQTLSQTTVGAGKSALSQILGGS